MSAITENQYNIGFFSLFDDWFLIAFTSILVNTYLLKVTWALKKIMYDSYWLAKHGMGVFLNFHLDFFWKIKKKTSWVLYV